jgi:hypothetical protein
MKKELPEIIKEVGFDFSWDEKKVWALELPTEELDTSELVWHFDIPFIWSKPNGFYGVKPSEVLNIPEQYPKEYQRTMDSDLAHPIDIMRWKGRWVILDGLHRLMKARVLGLDKVNVRKVSKDQIPLILKD